MTDENKTRHSHGVTTIELGENDCALIFRADGREFVTQAREVFMKGVGGGGLPTSPQLFMGLVTVSMLQMTNFDLWQELVERLKESGMITLKTGEEEGGMQ